MDELPADLRAFLLNHPFLQLTDDKKVSEQNGTTLHETHCSHAVMLAVLLSPIMSQCVCEVLWCFYLTLEKLVNDYQVYCCTRLNSVSTKWATCLFSDPMHPKWPRVSMQPDRAAEVHSREKIWETECCCRVQLQPVWATHCAKHQTTVRRLLTFSSVSDCQSKCHSEIECVKLISTLCCLSVFFLFPPAISSSVSWPSDTSTGSPITSWDTLTGNASRKLSPNVSALFIHLHLKLVIGCCVSCVISVW